MTIFSSNAGQVHRARLKGQDVVVKVQRPGLKDLFDIDLKNLRVSIIIISYSTYTSGAVQIIYYFLIILLLSP